MIGRVLSVPDEVRTLVEEGSSLLVKGMPGSGKTSFALSILERFSGGTKVYVSTRLSQEAFFKFFPWARSFLSDKSFVDARSPKIPSKGEWLPLKYTSGPEFIEAVYFKLKGGDVPRIVVIDSLDALKFILNMPYEDIQLEKLLLEMAESTGSSMIFVAETFGSTPLDYVVDGIVVLGWRLVKGFLVREIFLEKVRGKRIVFPARCFTLRDGVFRVIEPCRYELGGNVSPPPVKRISGGVIPTNIDGMDEVLGGGLMRGGVTLLDVGVGVGVDYRWIVIPPMLNAAMQGCPAVFIPSAGFSGFDVENSFKPFLKGEELRRLIHTVEFAREEHENIHALSGESFVKDSEKLLEVADSVSSGCKLKNVLIFIGTDTLEHVYGASSAIRMINKILTSSRVRGHTVFLVAKQGQEMRRALLHMVDVHFRLESCNGVTLIKGENPPTRFYALTVDESSGYFRTMMVPVD